MRRFRNPRFAPESLERKLNPSGVVPVAVEVYVPADSTSAPSDSTSTDDSGAAAPANTTTTTTTNDGGNPIGDDSTSPTGPTLPG